MTKSREILLSWEDEDEDYQYTHLKTIEKILEEIQNKKEVSFYKRQFKEGQLAPNIFLNQASDVKPRTDIELQGISKLIDNSITQGVRT